MSVHEPSTDNSLIAEFNAKSFIQGGKPKS